MGSWILVVKLRTGSSGSGYYSNEKIKKRSSRFCFCTWINSYKLFELYFVALLSRRFWFDAFLYDPTHFRANRMRLASIWKNPYNYGRTLTSFVVFQRYRPLTLAYLLLLGSICMQATAWGQYHEVIAGRETSGRSWVEIQRPALKKSCALDRNDLFTSLCRNFAQNNMLKIKRLHVDLS